MTITTQGFELTDWQESAVDAWSRGIDGREHRGTIEVVTGGGKTLIALRCVAQAAILEPDLRVAVVVPTQALARQWREAIARFTSVDGNEIGLLGAGGGDDLSSHRVIVTVLNTAARKLPAMASNHQPLMLIVDECHRAGAPSFSRVLDTAARFRLGLSATPDREEVDENGEPLAYDEQIVGRRLGPVVFRFGLKEARLAGWLPEFTLHHHAVSLTGAERQRYETLSRQVDDAADSLRGLGGDTSRSRHLVGRQDDVGLAARRWVALTGQRKDLLFRARERHRVAGLIVQGVFGDDSLAAPRARAILFHERVDEAVELWEFLTQNLDGVKVALEHSRLPERERAKALSDFASGEASILVSVKSLIEGIDVPAADTGISVASTASVRQRIQALGRVLRRGEESLTKTSSMHLLHIDDTVDDLIYGKTDWSDLTGAEANSYWRWPEQASEPDRLDGPPRTPKPGERAAWEQLGAETATLPAPWPGEAMGNEYSVSTSGEVHNAFQRLIANAQGVAEMVELVRGRPGGRFRVTPELRLVLVTGDGDGDETRQWWVAGRLSSPFEVAEEIDSVPAEADLSKLSPGAPYPGPTDKTGGTFRLSQRQGGRIQRAVRGGKEFALHDGASSGALNARQILEAWNQLNRPVSRFFINDLGHAWYESGGGRRFLAAVPSGFEWPGEGEGS